MRCRHLSSRVVTNSDLVKIPRRPSHSRRQSTEVCAMIVFGPTNPATSLSEICTVCISSVLWWIARIEIRDPAGHRCHRNLSRCYYGTYTNVRRWRERPERCCDATHRDVTWRVTRESRKYARLGRDVHEPRESRRGMACAFATRIRWSCPFVTTWRLAQIRARPRWRHRHFDTCRRTIRQLDFTIASRRSVYYEQRILRTLYALYLSSKFSSSNYFSFAPQWRPYIDVVALLGSSR